MLCFMTVLHSRLRTISALSAFLSDALNGEYIGDFLAATGTDWDRTKRYPKVKVSSDR